MTRAKEQIEKMAEEYADSLERRMTSMHNGLKVGYTAGCLACQAEKYTVDFIGLLKEREKEIERLKERLEFHWKLGDTADSSIIKMHFKIEQLQSDKAELIEQVKSIKNEIEIVMKNTNASQAHSFAALCIAKIVDSLLQKHLDKLTMPLQ